MQIICEELHFADSKKDSNNFSEDYDKLYDNEVTSDDDLPF